MKRYHRISEDLSELAAKTADLVITSDSSSGGQENVMTARDNEDFWEAESGKSLEFHFKDLSRISGFSIRNHDQSDRNP